jgi:hypothetical protein
VRLASFGNPLLKRQEARERLATGGDFGNRTNVALQHKFRGAILMISRLKRFFVLQRNNLGGTAIFGTGACPPTPPAFRILPGARGAPRRQSPLEIVGVARTAPHRGPSG